MAKKRTILDLGARERQVMEAVLRVGEGSVRDINAAIPDSPGDVIVRATLGELAKKDLVQFWNIKNRYFYRAVTPLEKTRKAVLSEITLNLFNGNTGQAAITLLESGRRSISAEELECLAAIIEKVRQEQKSKKDRKRKKGTDLPTIGSSDGSSAMETKKGEECIAR